MDRFHIAIGEKTVTLEIRDQIDSALDDNCDIHVTFDDAGEFWTTCYTVSNLQKLFESYRLSGENAHGLFIEVRGIVVEEMSPDDFRRTVETILVDNDGEPTEVFREIDRTSDDE